MELTAFIKDVLTLVLRNECRQALGDIDLLTVHSIENSGAGSYIHFNYKCDILRTVPLPPHIGSSIALNIDGLKGGAGCILFFEDHKIKMLELFSYGNEWPEEIRGYTLTTIR